METATRSTQTPSLAVVILAAGKGTRMKSDLAKVLHPLAGKPLLDHVLAAAGALGPERVVAVVGHQADKVKETFAGRPGLSFAIQEPQLGTGHAVMAAAPELSDFDGPVLILCGDVPLITPATLGRLLATHLGQGDALTVLGMALGDPGAYGRLVADGDGRLARIVEYRDASEAERAINIVNAGIYVAQAGPLLEGLKALKNDNDQAEYYLTDLVEILNLRGLRVGYELCPDPHEVAGVNSREQLAQLEEVLASRA